MLLLGQGREVEARRVGTFSIYLGLNVSAPFALLMGLFMRSVLNMLVADEQTFAHAWQYAICIIVAGGVTTVLFNALSNLLRNTGRSTATGFGIILGAGVATCIPNCIMLLFFPCAAAQHQGLHHNLQPARGSRIPGEHCGRLCRGRALGDHEFPVRLRLCHSRQAHGVLSQYGACGGSHRAAGGALPAQYLSRHLSGHDAAGGL